MLEVDWKGSGTVLVVDDEAHVRTITELMLTQFGLTVLTATDGLEGVRSVTEHDHIDLVLMDLTMPRMGGHEALSQMRSRRPDLPVILTSGYNEADALKANELTDIGFLQKPFELTELIALVREILERPGASRPGKDGGETRRV
jgi:two-component system cell cycle sensor histidine kinase/response regulator CckA